MNYTEKETKMQRDSFVFYRSYYEAIELLPKSQRADAYRAIFEFMFNGNDITDELPNTAKAIFLMAKPTLEASNKKYEAGKKGAEAKKANKEKADDKQPDKQSESNLDSKQQATSQANDKQPTKQNGSNVNVNVNDNVNVNVNENLEEKKEKKEIYACDEILEEALNKSDVSVLLNDLGVDEEFVKDLIFYREEIEKPIKTISGLRGLLKDILETSLKSRKSPQELVETMKENEWKTIKYDYLAPSELGPPKNYTKKDVVSQNMEAVRQAIEMRKRMKGAV